MKLLRETRNLLSDLKFVIRVAANAQHRQYIMRWLESRRPNYLLKKPYPWMNFAVVDFITERIQPNWKIFEYGSGGSTLYWLSLGAEVVSVEHDPEWYAIVKKAAGDNAKLDYRLVLPEPPNPENSASIFDPSDPSLYFSNDPSLRYYTFSKYARQIDEFPNSWFDMVVVDGRARPSCISHAISKVRSGGMLVVDNVEREYYLRNTLKSLEGRSDLRFTGLVPAFRLINETVIFMSNI